MTTKPSTISSEWRTNRAPCSLRLTRVSKLLVAFLALAFIGGASAKTQICVCKFYDANANGKKDAGEPYIYGWQFDVFGDSVQIEAYTPAKLKLAPGEYQVIESLSTEGNWLATTATEFDVNLLQGQTVYVKFGNLCLGAGGGLTLGFWSNKNGQALESVADFAALTALHLRNADGSDRDFTSDLATNKADLHDWLLSANAVNMSNMLSAQLAAMVLNVSHGDVDGAALVHTNGCGNTGVNDEFITINDLISAAEAALATDGHAVDGDPNRDLQECLKDALDDANNNLNFVQAGPCDFSFGE
jgi:hypothetical protein